MKKTKKTEKPKLDCMMCGTKCQGWEECVAIQRKRKQQKPGPVLYDTGKMGTPEHRASVEVILKSIKQQYPHLTRYEVILLKVMRESSFAVDTSGGGPRVKFLAHLDLKYGKVHH